MPGRYGEPGVCLCHARVGSDWVRDFPWFGEKIRHSGGLLMGTGCPRLLWSPSRMSKWDPLVVLTQGCCGPRRQLFSGHKSLMFSPLVSAESLPTLCSWATGIFSFLSVQLASGQPASLAGLWGISAPVLAQVTLQALLLGTKLLRSGFPLERLSFSHVLSGLGDIMHPSSGVHPYTLRCGHLCPVAVAVRPGPLGEAGVVYTAHAPTAGHSRISPPSSPIYPPWLVLFWGRKWWCSSYSWLCT